MKEKIFVTLLVKDDEVAVGDMFALEKDKNNAYDDEAIRAVQLGGEDEDGCCVGILDGCECYVANSVNTVARGTYSAGRLYDKFEDELKVKVMFVVRGVAICEVI